MTATATTSTTTITATTAQSLYDLELNLDAIEDMMESMAVILGKPAVQNHDFEGDIQ